MNSYSQDREVQCWSRTEFDPKRWKKGSDLEEEEDDEASIPECAVEAMTDAQRNKKTVRTLFTKILDDHFRFAAEICGLKYPKDGALLPVWDSPDMAASIAHDPSPLNVKRLCWLLYYSSGQFYKRAYGCYMSDYLESEVLKLANAKYNEDEESKTKGCVSLYMNKLINQYRVNVRECLLNNRHNQLGSIQNSRPDNFPSPDKPLSRKKREAQCLFWVGTKQGTIMTRKKKKGKETVSERPVLSFQEVKE